MIELNRGIRIAGTGLWLDSTKARPLGFISHAHGDHTAKHAEVVSTETTWELCRKRLGEDRKRTLLEFGRSYPMGDYGVKLFPSGHMLGAAQILIENGTRIVYTGDFKLSPGWTTPGAATPECDVLIMETTFGKPRYVFPSAEEVAGQLVDFIERCFEDRRIPVLLAYQMGKSQEAVKVLGDRGYTLCVPRQVLDVIKAYESCGQTFRNYEPLSLGNLHGKVVLVPPYLVRSRMMAKIPNRRTVFLSGWAMDPDARERFGVDEVIPMSDHAGFDELNAYVDRVRPGRVFTVHGGPEFADHLRRRGVRAEHLVPGTQLTMW